MFCSKIGSDCPHPVGTDEKLIFVMMPFKGFNSVYDAIEQAVTGIEGKDFKCERADKVYTNVSIWCDTICKSIRRAKYVIVDTTGSNPNVFYELGFAHALENTKAIIITQKIKEAPFDIIDIRHMIYSEKELPVLREELTKAILALEAKEADESYANKTAEEVVIDLKAQLRTEEQRSADFKNQLVETEKREKQYKEQIREIEAIQTDPAEEAKKRIITLEGAIGELRAKLKLTEKDKRDTIERLNETLEEKEQKLAALEKDLKTFKASKNTEPLADTLLDDTKNRSEAIKWAMGAYDEYQKGNKEKAIELYSKAIELDPNYALAYNNRGAVYAGLNEHERAIQDYNNALDLDPNDPDLYHNRGLSYGYLRDYERAIQDCNKALELDPKFVRAYTNISELKIITGKYKEALVSIQKILPLATTTEHKAIGLYLDCIARKLLELDTSETEKAFDELLEQVFSANWSCHPIEQWLEEADIDEETKTFIAEKTEMLKKHVR
jgi:tetratricopeptide (TPR) repeat protein